jgi:hypothetical protein
MIPPRRWDKVPRMRNSNHSFFLGALILVAALAVPGLAHAQQGGGRGLGVGLTTTLGGVTGGTLVYDASSFHIQGLLGFQSVDNDYRNAPDLSALAIGGEFLFHVSMTPASDFGIGGGLTLVQVSTDGPGGDSTDIHIEALAQIRAFIVPNVAISGGLGLLIVSADNDRILSNGIANLPGGDSIAFGASLFGELGLTYFF